MLARVFIVITAALLAVPACGGDGGAVGSDPDTGPGAATDVGPDEAPDASDGAADPAEDVEEDAGDGPAGDPCQTSADCAVREDLGPCEAVVCDADSGECIVGAVKAFDPCDDGDGCTAGEVCSEDGVCAGGEPLDCEDDNPCTDDSCDPEAAACVNAAHTAPCEDGDPCTAGDVCAEGACVPGQVVCECVDDAGCADQEDGDACNGTLICVVDTCEVDPETVVDCGGASPNPCIAGPACDPATGACVEAQVQDGTGCDDGDACTLGDACEAGVCGGVGAVCDDQDPCTADYCWPPLGCLTAGIPFCGGDPCGDGACAGTETCVTCEADCGVCPSLTDCCAPKAGGGCHDDGCQVAICEVLPECCDTAWGQPCADIALAECANCAPPASPGDCCQTGAGKGCIDAGCAALVCAEEEDCCDAPWGVACAKKAILMCDVCGAGMPPGGECCFEHLKPNCSDQNCGGIVCGLEPSCCESAWDSQCAELATQVCKSCTGGDPQAGACCKPNGTPGCEDYECETIVCGIDDYCCAILWDETCVWTSQAKCPICKGPMEGDCCAANPSPGCEDAGCQGKVCKDDTYCCDVEWDDLCVVTADAICPVCAPPPDGTDCCSAQDGPGCSDATCEEAVCDEEFSCCSQEWDEDCAEEALKVCKSVCGGGSGTGSCCHDNGTAGCTDKDCEDAVCASDKFCCQSVWDGLCADSAADKCKVCGGGVDEPVVTNCCAEHNGTGCTDPTCSGQVCGQDPFCCNTQWDGLCADAAVSGCAVCQGGGGGGPGGGAGDCCAANGTAGCDDSGCEAKVCAQDAFCCDAVWDAGCGSDAKELCDSCAAALIGCCVEHDPPGCSDPTCEEQICATDPFCCDDAWDAVCTKAAKQKCGVCNPDCCEAKSSSGCSVPECQQAVCAQDSFCCSSGWDSLCAGAAESLCAVCQPICGDDICLPKESCSTCPLDCGPCPFCGDGLCNQTDGCHNCPEDCGACEGECCVTNSSPGCDDQNTSLCVCQKDPSCCDAAWDSSCVEAAYGCGCSGHCGDGDCEPDEGCNSCPQDCGECAPDCCISNGTPGCGDPDCTAQVCAIDSFCCSNSWDSICAGEAQDLCEACGAGGGGGGGGGGADCCYEKSSPGCSDSSCSSTVCSLDPFCCQSSWDSLCSGAAAIFCPVCGGFGF